MLRDKVFSETKQIVHVLKYPKHTEAGRARLTVRRAKGRACRVVCVVRAGAIEVSVQRVRRIENDGLMDVAAL